jgi:DnaJ-class molecular chaperone
MSEIKDFCLTCDGRGSVVDPDPYADRRQMVTCRTCQGSGRVPAGKGRPPRPYTGRVTLESDLKR